MRYGRPRTCRTLATLLAIALIAGCGYSVRPPFDRSIRTVYVPIFKSVSFRRDLNLQLTELVQKEIERRTGYKVVGSPDQADTTLEGTVVFAEKNVMLQNPNNLPRELMGMLTVQARWIDNRNPDPAAKVIPPVTVVENLPFFPEVGETTTLAYQHQLERIARDIVNMMEQPW